jgi:putative flippase GtrA
MAGSNVEFGVARSPAPAGRVAAGDPLRNHVEFLPRPVRFLVVGGLGLITDLSVFSALIIHGANPLAARVLSLAVATLLTWRLNRALTFDYSGRRPADEAARYATVAVTAQAVSYSVFAVLVVGVSSLIPQIAVLIGAAAGALVSYSGQALFAFRPRWHA